MTSITVKQKRRQECRAKKNRPNGQWHSDLKQTCLADGTKVYICIVIDDYSRVLTALGTVGYAAVGTLLAAIAVNARAPEVMLPILFLPLATPALIAAVQATGGLVEGGTLAEVGGWVRLLVAYDLIVVAVAMVTFGYVVEE